MVVEKVPDWYKFLDIPHHASKREISSAFRKNSRLYHPNKNKDKRATRRFQILTRFVNETLLKGRERRKYDHKLANYQAYQMAHDVSFFVKRNSGENPKEDVFEENDSGLDELEEASQANDQASDQESDGRREEEIHEVTDNEDNDSDSPNSDEPKVVILDQPVNERSEPLPERLREDLEKQSRETVEERPVENVEGRPREDVEESPREDVAESPREDIAESPREVSGEQSRESAGEQPRDNVGGQDLLGDDTEDDHVINRWIEMTEISHRWEKDGDQIYLVPRKQFPCPVWSMTRGYLNSAMPTRNYLRLTEAGFAFEGVRLILAYRDLGMTPDHFSPLWRSIEGEGPERWPRLRRPLTFFNYNLVGQKPGPSMDRQQVQERLHHLELTCKVTFDPTNFVEARTMRQNLGFRIKEMAYFMNEFSPSTRREVLDERKHLGVVEKLLLKNWKNFKDVLKMQRKDCWEDYEEIPVDYHGGMRPLI